MTPAQVMTLLRGRLGARGATDQLQTYMIQELNAAQTSFEDGPTYYWFLETWSSDISVASDSISAYITLPTDFLSEIENAQVVYTDSSGTKHDLEARFFDELQSKQNISGTPKFYCVQKNVMRIFPNPGAVGTIKFQYNGAQDQLDSNGDYADHNYWYANAPLLLMNEAGYQISSKYLKDQALAQIFMQDKAEYMDKLFRKHVSREVSRQELSLQKLQFAVEEQ